jgi:hypothetical protein
MDSFGAHFPDDALGTAAELLIEVIPVPKGLTGQCQPLDRRCFGPVKGMSQYLWAKKTALNPKMRWNHIEAAKLLEDVWDTLKRQTVLSAWNFGDGDDPDADDESLDEEVLEEGHNSQEADPTFTMRSFRQVRELDTTEESEPGSDGVLGRLEHVESMVQQSHQRTAAHRKEEDKVLKVDTGGPFYKLEPPVDGAMERVQEKANEAFWRARSAPPPEKPEEGGPGTPLPPAFPPPGGRRRDQPEPVIGPDGFEFPRQHCPPVADGSGDQTYDKNVWIV